MSASLGGLPSGEESPLPNGLAPTTAVALARLHASQLASNVPLSASAELNPRLTPRGLLGQLLPTWERIFVLCYRDTCPVHRPSGAADGRRMWWPAIQRRVVVFDAEQIDRQNAHVVRWAGCELAERSAGRSGEPVLKEPCTFTHRSGGVDWRRTAKHRLLALLAHLTLVEEAKKRNLTSVLILEADLVASIAVQELSQSASHAALLAHRLRRAFATHEWAVARLSSMFYSKEYLPGGRRRHGSKACTRKCRCRPWIGSQSFQALASGLQICEVSGAPQSSDTISQMLKDLHSWCDVRDTAAYAVHRSAFGVFTDYLDRLRLQPHWLRNNALEVPAIDNWLPHALPCLYVLPSLVSQPSADNSSQRATALMRQTSARNFMAYCTNSSATSYHASSESEQNMISGRPMKLHHFATRHLYVLS
ncbi:MAG: hypothetical protein SGPRY_009182 [Prymnesium sp.]